MNKVLVVDDDKILQDSLKAALEYHHFFVETADNGRQAVEKVMNTHYDLVVMDVNMPEMDGIEALSQIKRKDQSIIVLILTAFSNVSDAVRAVKEGAYNYLEKPISTENLVSLIKRALKARSMVETTAFSAPTLSLGQSEDDKFVGESNSMQKVFGVISKLAKVNTPVLIRGESGTGKELVAKAIHFNGPRKDEKFVAVNCGAISENLIESELFGHEKGAFTGADSRKIGKFQFAEGGTLFLDEIGDISQSMQVKLLRILQEKKFTPVGSNREINVDVRIIAASHKPFEEMIKDGSFREDLFYRLNVLPVYLPPLRERKTDIPHLVNYYISYFNDIHALEIKGVSKEVENAFNQYSWPGNIRELRNSIEHAFIMESSDTITLDSLPTKILNEKNNTSSSNQNNDDNDDKRKVAQIIDALEDRPEESSRIDLKQIRDSVLDEQRPESASEGLTDFQFLFAKKEDGDIKMDFQVAKDQFEKEFIQKALEVNLGKINQTALNANIPKKTLLRKIEKYEINPKDYYQK